MASSSKQVVSFVLNDFLNDSRVLKTASCFARSGFSVTVVALHNGTLARRERRGAVRVDRIKLWTRSWKKIRVVQSIKYIEFLIRSFLLYRKVPICYCNDLNTLPIGFLIKVFGGGCYVIYDSHELAINDSPNQTRVAIFLRKVMEGFLIRFVDEVIVVSDSIGKVYSRMYSIPTPHTILNCPPFSDRDEQNIFREKFDIADEQNIFLYQGALCEGRGIHSLINTFMGFNTNRSVIIFMGYGPLLSVIEDAAKNSDLIFYHPAVSPEKLLSYTSSADFGVAFIEDVCLSYRYCLPNKLFEYLMAGLPVLTSNVVEMKRFVEHEGVGVVAADNSVAGLRSGIKTILDSDYQVAQSHILRVRKKYSWENQEKALKEIISGL